MSGACGCLFALWAATASVEAVAGADTQLAAGAAPLNIVGPTEPTVALTLTPLAGLRLSSPTQTLSATYTPRLFLREPNSFELDRPLILHQGNVQHTWSSQLLSWENNLRVSVGEVDYTATAVVFRSSGTRPVRATVADLLRLDAQSSLAIRASERTQWGFVAVVEHTSSLNQVALVNPLANAGGMVDDDMVDDDAQVLGDPVPATLNVTGVSFFQHRLSRAHRVSARGILGHQSFADTGNFLLLSPEVGYEYLFQRDGAFSLNGGVVYVHQLSVPDQTNPVPDSVGGTGNVSISGRLAGGDGVQITGQMGGGFEWVFDPILQRSQPGAFANVSSEMRFGRRLRVQPTLTFFTLLNNANTDDDVVDGEPVDPMDPTPVPIPSVFATTTNAPDSTMLFAAVPVTYWFHENWAFKAGARMILRGRSLDSPDFELGEQKEYWLYAGLTWVLSTKTYEAGASPDWLTQQASDVGPGRN